MFGFNVLPCWNFTVKGTLQPYLFGGGGLVYTDAEIKGLGGAFERKLSVGRRVALQDQRGEVSVH